MSQQLLDKLQAQLVVAAAATPPNIELIQRLTGEIARLDPDNVRFTIDAGLINRLGQELVGKQETAVAELIKNAYDADATEVRIIYENSFLPGGTLLIEDDGVGMSREQLLNGFMRLSSNDKLVHPVSERFKRRRAGRKGIGRFAVQRLGDALVLTTQTANSDTALMIKVNWNDFEIGRELSSIASHIQEVPKERVHGTTLFIENLRDAWSNAEQRRVYRYVSDILQPYPLTKFKKKSDIIDIAAHKQDEAAGFNVRLLQQTTDELEVIASQESTIYANSLANIEGYVDHNGQGIWSVESDKFELGEEISLIGKNGDSNHPFKYLKNVSIKAYYYIWKADLFPNTLFSSLREIGRNHGGIKIFRNGFRVPPYGERGEDWLELDASSGRRKFLPPHANVNFIGFVELDDLNGVLFEELSSREGLIENKPFEELKEFIYAVLIAAVLRIAEIREKKQTANQVDWKEEPTDPVEILREVAADLRKASKIAQERNQHKSTEQRQFNTNDRTDNSNNESDNYEQDSNNFDKAADTLDALAANTQKILQENQLLRVLASMGILIGEFTHEVKHVVGAAQHSIDVLENAIIDGDTEKKALDWLADSVSRLEGYSAFFDNTVSETVRRDLEPQDLRTIGRHFEEAMAASIERMDINFEFNPEGFELFTPPMHAAEINSLLFNFYSNSLKAIKRAKTDGKMLLQVGEDNGKVYLEFSDNGDGIPEANRERIFNAFFTTATPASRSSTAAEESQGSGLGLKIVSDIVHSYNGEVFITKASEGFSTCFRVEFPAHVISE